MDDLKERLREVPAIAFEYEGQVGIEELTLAHEAADRIEALEAKLAVAREALEYIWETSPNVHDSERAPKP